ncbi:MAG: glutamate--tRNA ligase family protein, partial [Rhodospirillaceae bacterium]|nr:glutamate--tRNA ligase family protein [Rhodospirillaceae bacterium]
MEPGVTGPIAPGRAITRFAPSPTGHLHVGHARAALIAAEAAGTGR